jgi:hypothetical protein
MRSIASVMALGLLLAGCTSTSGQGSPPAATGTRPAAPQLRVTVQQQRVDATTRIVGVNTTNRGTAPVHVSAVRLTGGGLPGRVTPLDTDLQPGLTVALRGSYGRPHCGDRSTPVTAHLKIGGAWIDYPVNRAGQQEVRRLLDTDCAAITLARTADVRLTGPYRSVTVRGAPYLRGELLISRRSAAGAVDLRSLAGSVLVDLRPVDQLEDLPAGKGEAVTPVLLGSTGRCDPHGLGQATQTFLLSAYVRLAGSPEQRVVLTPPRAVQNRVLRVVDKACGTS